MIRRANKEDIKFIMPIYEAAKKKMRADGNLHQWSDKYPDEETLLNDIVRDELYVAHDCGKIYGVFMRMLFVFSKAKFIASMSKFFPFPKLAIL